MAKRLQWLFALLTLLGGGIFVYAQNPVSISQLGTTAVDTNSGNKSAGTQRVVLATDQPQLTNALKVDGSAVTQPISAASLPLPTGAATEATLSTLNGKVTAVNTGAVTITVFPDNEPFNVAQIAGTTAATNSGNKDAGTLRVVLATDQPQLTNKLLVTPDANSAVNVSQINGVTPLMGAGNTGTGSHRVTIATDQAALAGLAIYTEDAGETAGGNLSMAGSVRRDTAASSAGASGDNATLNTDDTGKLWARMADPCSAYDKTFAPFSISTATTTVIIAASASNKNYICSLEIVVAGADNVALVEDASGSCASPDAGMAGGTTAASGWNFAANSGLARGNGNGTVYKTASTNVNTCLITSAAVQASGVVSYVQKP